MTNKLEIVQPIDKSSLDQAHYFASLVDKAASLGLLENAGDIKRQTLMLTAKLAQRLTFGASSSIKEETAQSLLESVFYCVGRRLKAMETGDALKSLKQNSVESIWSEGRELTKRDVAKARSLYESLRETALETENIAYNDTLGEGIASFFRLYDIDFAAHEIPGMIDYFLCIELPELSGAEYMLAYLERLGVENGFCAYYGRDVETLLRSHSEYWRELNVNIFELVLTNAIGRVLCGNDARSLDISAAGREKLKPKLAAMSRQRLKAVICAASQRVCTEAGASDALKSYALSAAGQISARVYFALQTDTLGEVFVEYKAPVKKSRFVDAPPMDDDAFRALTDEIRGCRRMSDKLGLIKNIRSIKDLEDMLGASCLYGGEFEALFGTLGDEVLALLYLHVPEDGALHVTEDEKEWQAALFAYLEKTGKAARIREAAEGLERE
jgi:hypothetical protein